MQLKISRRLMALFASLLPFLAAQAMTEAINYSGRLVPVNGRAFNGQSPMTMTFRLYDAATDGTLLWGRRYPVIVATDGTFSIALTDTEGVAVEGAKFADLAAACAAPFTDGKPLYVGLTPVDTDGDVTLELTPRQQLGTIPAAEVAAVARATDETVVSSLFVNGTLTAKNATVGDLTTSNAVAAAAFAPAEGAVLATDGEITIGDNYMKTTSFRDFYSQWEFSQSVFVCNYSYCGAATTLVYAFDKLSSDDVYPARLKTEFWPTGKTVRVSALTPLSDAGKMKRLPMIVQTFGGSTND